MLDNKNMLRAEEIARHVIHDMDNDNMLLVHKEDTNDYVLITEDIGFICLITRPYSAKNLNILIDQIKYTQAHERIDVRKNIGFIFYKDGTDYFRSSLSPKNTLRNIRHMDKFSNYSNQELQKIMTLTKVEKQIAKSEQCVTYFQPESARLEKMILTYSYKHMGRNWFEYQSKTKHSGIIKPRLYQIKTSNDYTIK